MRKLRMLLTLLLVSVCSWQSAWAQEEVVVSVSLAQAGELGIEILRQHDPITAVTDLTVTGTMNDEDWAMLKDITALKFLDLSGVTNESVPEFEFSSSSNLISVALPSKLKVLGRRAFSDLKKLESVVLPTTLENLGEYTFYNCSALVDLHITELPSGIKEIPDRCFCYCKALSSFTIPEGITSIGDYAFRDCKQFSSTIPLSVNYIGYSAFCNSAMNIPHVTFSEGFSTKYTSDGGTFQSTGIQSISFPTTYFKNIQLVINNCTKLTDIYLKSPTVLTNPEGLLKGCTSIERIHVPAHLVEAYKLDSYFKNYSSMIVGDATDDYTGWTTISQPLTLSYNRMAGSPNIILKNSMSLEVKGDANQYFGNVVTYGHTARESSTSSSIYKYGNKDWSMIINTCDNVSITGTLEHKIQTYKGKWYFFCLPFDFKVGDIVTENNIKYAIRYYDGYNRATVTTNNWKNFGPNDIVPAGTGFILQTSATTWVTFKAQDNDSKQNVMSNSAFTKTLADNPSETAANKGWNLVGNPWQSYYNIHKINYRAPISVWSGSTYVAYSLTDDDYAIRPNEAFFVQSPGNNATIEFPTDGRQLTEDIVSQNGARGAVASERQIVDIQITGNNELTDKTRLVVNPEASLDYEISCDAGKLMSMDVQVPQVYSLGLDDTQYAINERPADNGELRLGVIIHQDGQYSISAIRNSLGQVLLRDNEAGITTDLSQNGYSFDAQAGTYDSRFMLMFGDNMTAISHVKNAASEAVKVYTLDGREVSNSTDGLKQGVYVVRKGQKTQKVIIK